MDGYRVIKRNSRIPYDRMLENRMVQYMENKADPRLTVDDITDHLRNKFFEYGRRKRHALKMMVAQIYSEISSHLPDEIEVEDSDSELYNGPQPEEVNSNRANNSFSDLYSKNNKKDSSKEESKTGDFIDISSDTSDNEENNTKKLKTDDENKTDKVEDNEPVKIIEEKILPNNNELIGEEISKLNGTVNVASMFVDNKDDKDQPNIKIIEEKLVPLDAKKSQNVCFITNNRQEGCETPKNSSKRPLSSDNNVSLTAKKKRREIIPTETKLSFKDIGGNEKVLKEVVKLSFHMKHLELYNTIGEPPPRGFLLHGPPGSGKTLLAHALAGELKVPLLKVAGPEIIGGISGQSEERIRDLFDQAVSLAPCIIFFDEVDAISPDRESASKDMERRIVAQLLTCLDSLEYDDRGKQVLIIGATNRPDSIDPALRRAGRFEREVCLGIPDRDNRLEMLKVMTQNRKLSADISLQSLAEKTPGYVGADLKALMREAALSAISRVSLKMTTLKNSSESEVEVCSDELHINDLELKSLLIWYNDSTEISEELLSQIFVTKEDFETALKIVQPSSKREGFATVPNVTWEDVGSLKDIRHQLQMSIMFPVKYPKLFGKSTPSGVLLCGPPGCGKTLLAKAVANEAGINFISVKGPELLNMYLGESERAVRQVFQRARNSSPCVIFFDEIDALCPKRSGMSDNNSSMRIVNQLLTEMDGFEGRGGVFLMAATNRPDIIDPAVMRPGRFDRILFVNLPNELDRKEILLALTKQGKDPIMSEDVQFEKIAADERCQGYSGADLEQLVKEAREQAILEVVNAEKETPVDDTEEIKIYYRHFDTALKRIKPSVSKVDCKNYEALRERYTNNQ